MRTVTIRCDARKDQQPGNGWLRIGPKLSVDRRAILPIISIPFLTHVPASSAAAPKKGDAGDWSSPGLNAPIPEGQPKFVKLDNGIRYQELSEGVGSPAGPKSLVLVDYVLRRANGYFIYSTVEGVSFQPKDIPVGPVLFKMDDPRLIAGLREAVQGMKPGAKRRILVPPELGYASDTSLQPQPPGFAAQRQVIVHSKEPLLFEIVCLRVDGQGVGKA